MFDSLLSLIPGGSLTAMAAAAVAVLIGVWRVFVAGQKSGEDRRKVKEAEARAKNLEDIKRAANAKPVGGVSDDPHNRDNQ